MLDDEHREKFKADVAQLKLRSGKPRVEAVLPLVAIVLMLGGIVGAFVAYAASLSESDSRSVGSFQILAIACLALVVAGAATFITTRISGLLRMWLLRQLYQGNAQTEQLAEALRTTVNVIPGEGIPASRPAELNQR
jgi:hypothetical protein